MSSLKELQALIHEKYGIGESALDPHASMRETGLDSLTLVEFLFAVEDRFHISMPEADSNVDTLNELDHLRVSSTKALHGHLLGAAGALEAIVTVLALRRRQLPPNAHCAEIDPACRLALVPQAGAAAPQLDIAISNSFAFGGTNAVLVFKRA